MNKKIVYFDFCETLVNFQTADAYVDFVRNNLSFLRMNVLESIYLVLKKLRFFSLMYKLSPKGSIEKRFKLHQLKGISFELLDKLAYEYYKVSIKNNLIDELIAKLEFHKIHDYKVEIISGGYSIYLKYFCLEYGIDCWYSSEIDFNSKGLCTGRMLGKDCLFDNKVEILENSTSELKDVMTERWAYTDSPSDLPLLRWVDKGVVVSRGKEQFWARKLNFEQIVW